MSIYSRFLAAAVTIVTLLISACSSSPEQPYFDPEHSARNALDWAGVYRGVLPCADCEGIETVVILRSDGHYTSQSKYLGRSDELFAAQGRFEWNQAGSTVSFPEQDQQYFVAENRLFHLDQNGARIHGQLADKYVLAKLSDKLTGRDWTLVELNGRTIEPSALTPYFSLDSSNQRVSGYAGCNRFFGQYEHDEATSHLRFSKLASTKMACPSNMELEAAIFNVLNNADSYSFDGDTLSLSRAGKAPLARFEAVYLR